jgi:hypothetical protein
LFVCICVLNYCHRVATQLQLYHIISYHISYHIIYHIIYRIISYRISSYIISYISYHIIPYHISYCIISYQVPQNNSQVDTVLYNLFFPHQHHQPSNQHCQTAHTFQNAQPTEVYILIVNSNIPIHNLYSSGILHSVDW